MIERDEEGKPSLAKWSMAAVLLFFVLITLKIINNFITVHIVLHLGVLVMGTGTALLIIHTFSFRKEGELDFIAINYGFLGVLSLFSILALINPIKVDMTNLHDELWIFQRGYEAFVLLFFLFKKNKHLNYNRIIFINSLIFSMFFLMVFYFKKLPTTFQVGNGYTPFSFISNSLILAIFLLLAIKVFRERRKNPKEVVRFVLARFLLEALIVSDFLFFQFKGNFFQEAILVSELYLVLFIFKKRIINVIEELQRSCLGLKEEKELYKARCQGYDILLEDFPEAILIVKRGRIVYGNKKLQELLKLQEREKIYDRSFSSFIRKKDKKMIITLIREKGLIDRPVEVSISIERSSFPLELKALRFDKECCVVFTLREIQDELQTAFLTNISHEVKTPINVMYSALQLQKKYLEELSLEDIKKYNHMILKNCQRLIRLTNNIIDAGKISKGFLEAKLEVENIVQVIEDTALSITNYAKEKEINIIFDTEAEEFYSKCDADFLERIILNILSNAIKYGRQGGIIHINMYSSKEDTVAIAIKDDGI